MGGCLPRGGLWGVLTPSAGTRVSFPLLVLGFPSLCCTRVSLHSSFCMVLLTRGVDCHPLSLYSDCYPLAHFEYLRISCKYPVIRRWGFPFARLPPLRVWVSILLLVPYSLHAEGISDAPVSNLSSSSGEGSGCFLVSFSAALSLVSPLRQFWWLPVTPSVCLSLFLSSCGSLQCRSFLCFPALPVLVAACSPLCLRLSAGHVLRSGRVFRSRGQRGVCLGAGGSGACV